MQAHQSSMIVRAKSRWAFELWTVPERVAGRRSGQFLDRWFVLRSRCALGLLASTIQTSKDA